MLSEFGGIALSLDERSGWGYSRAADARDLLKRYAALMAAIWTCRETLAGFCYTQLTDTFQEKNGLLFMDRSPKADIEALCTATRGERQAADADQDPNPDPNPNPYGYSKRWRERQQKDRRQV